MLSQVAAIIMMNAEGEFIGHLCHIEAAEKGGERFNESMSNEERRHVSNLMLMCYPHHVKTDNVALYSVQKLKQMKADHEARFSHPDRVILKTLEDWTDADDPTLVKNLERMNRALGWGHEPFYLEEMVEELNTYVAKLRSVPIDLRKFMGAVAKRIVKMKSSRTVRTDFLHVAIPVSDLQGAFGLGARKIADLANQLDAYSIGDIGDIDTDLGPMPSVRIRNLKATWPVWMDIVAFCEVERVALEAFTDDLDFARLDD